MRRIHSLCISPPSLPLSSPPSRPPSFYPAPSSCLHPSLILSLPLRRPRASLDVSFCVFFFSPSLPTSFGRWLRGLPLSQGKGSRRDRAPLPRRAGCLTEPRSESVGVTKKRGASAWEKVLSGPKSQGAGRGRGSGRLEAVEKNTRRSARRLDRATNQLGLRLPSYREVAPGGAGGGRPARRGAAAAGGVGREAGKIDAAQSLPAFRSTSPASAPGGTQSGQSRRQHCPPASPLGAQGVARPSTGATTLSTLLQTSTHPLPGPFVPAAEPNPMAVFAPGLGRSGLLLRGSALLN